jgi:NAD(P)H-dependent flavin oxidoreductase YrpB (nitropropane dioxygenase family)
MPDSRHPVTVRSVDLLDRLRLEVPVAQAGMGGGLAGPELAVAVAAAGGLGTLGPARLPSCAQASVPRLQAPRLPFFSPAAPTVGMPESVVEQMALYAGETVLRLMSVTSARQAVADLAPSEQ